MQGSTNSKTLIREGMSVSATPKIIAEWNLNNYNRPRICGTVVNDSTTLSSPKFYTSTNFVTISTIGSVTLSGTSQRGSDVNTFNSKTKSFTYSYGRTATPTLSFPATSNYAYKISFYLKSNATTSENLMIHFIEKNGSTIVGGITRRYPMSYVQWKLNQISYSPLNTTTTVEIHFATEQTSTSSTTSVSISDFAICEVNEYEYNIEHLHPVDPVFYGFRSGDEIAEQGIDRTLSDVIYRSGTTQNIYGTSTARSITQRLVQSETNKLFMPSLSKLDYYISPVSYANVSSGLFAYYDKSITTNKLVIKMLNSGPSAMNNKYKNIIVDYTVWTYKASTNTWTPYNMAGTMNKNGSLILYWSGSTWNGTKNLATIDESNYSLSNTTSIDGIAFTVNKIGYISSGTTYTLGITADATMNAFTQFDTTLRFLEISPRLEIDLSTYAISFSSSEETDSGSLPIAVGLATSNNASVELENITRSYGGSTFSIFSDKSGVSPFSKLNLIDRDVKFRIKYSLTDLSTDTLIESDIPFFVGYVDSWSVSESSVTVSMFDYSKYLQKKLTKDLLLVSGQNSQVNLAINDIIKHVFEGNGFSDYNTLPDIGNNITLSNFYTDNQKTLWDNIQELILPYQLFGYFDKTGLFTLSRHSDKSQQANADFVFTDKSSPYLTDNSLTYTPNIISLKENINEKPGRVVVNYNSAYKHYSTDPATSNDALRIAERTTTQILWEAASNQGLGYTILQNTIGPTDSIITYSDLSQAKPETGWVQYSGYAVIGSEIIKFDGLEISYVDSSGATKYAIVKSEADLQYQVSQIITNNASTNNLTRWNWTGKVMNVERGMFGTKAQTHIANIAVSSITSYFSGAKANVITGHGSSPSASTLNAVCTTTRFDDTTYLNLNGYSASKNTVLYFDNQDSNYYNNYFFTFYIPQSTTNFNLTEDDRVGIVLGYEGSTPGSTTGNIYIEFIAETYTGTAITSIYYNNVVKATSNFKLDTNNPAITTTTKDRNNKVKTVVKKKASYDKINNISVSIDSSKKLNVKVNGRLVKFSNDFIVPDAVTRGNKGFGIYVTGKNTIAIDTISAWQSGTFMISPNFRTSTNCNPILYGSVNNKTNVQPFYFSLNSAIFGMEIFDVDLSTGPAFNQQIVKTTGAYEIKDSNSDSITTMYQITPGASIVSNVVGSPYKAKFIYINAGEAIIPLSGTGQGTFNSTKVYGNTMVKSPDIQYIESIDKSVSNNNDVSITSDWIQNATNAKIVAKAIMDGVLMSGNTIEIEAFGNPLISVGDVVKIKYYKSNIISDSYYVVIGADVKWNNGFNSTFTVRKVK